MDKKLMAITAFTIFLTGFIFKSYAESTIMVDDRAKLGEVYSLEKLKQYAQAMPTIEDLYQRYADNREVQWTYVRVLGFGGHWKEAMKVFDQLCAVKCDEEMFVTYAHILEAQGSKAQTLMYIKSLADQHPAQEKIQAVYAEILSWNVQNPQNHHMIEELSAKYPDDLKLIKAHADILVERKKYADAMALMDQLLARDPKNNGLRYQHAQVVSATGDHKQAVKELQALLNDGFTKKDAVIMLGDELRRLGRDEEALKVYKEVTDGK